VLLVPEVRERCGGVRHVSKAALSPASGAQGGAGSACGRSFKIRIWGWGEEGIEREGKCPEHSSGHRGSPPSQIVAYLHDIQRDVAPVRVNNA